MVGYRGNVQRLINYRHGQRPARKKVTNAEHRRPFDAQRMQVHKQSRPDSTLRACGAGGTKILGRTRQALLLVRLIFADTELAGRTSHVIIFESFPNPSAANTELLVSHAANDALAFEGMFAYVTRSAPLSSSAGNQFFRQTVTPSWQGQRCQTQRRTLGVRVCQWCGTIGGWTRGPASNTGHRRCSVEERSDAVRLHARPRRSDDDYVEIDGEDRGSSRVRSETSNSLG